MDKKRKIAIGFSIFFIVAGFIFCQLGIKWSIALVLIQIFFFSGLVVIPLMGWHGRSKQAYDLYGGIIAYLLLHLTLYLWYPNAFEFVTFMNAFWVFETLFLIVNCALLGRTSFTIFSTRMATLVFMTLALGYILIQFTEYGQEVDAAIAHKVDILMENVVRNQTKKAVTYGKAKKMRKLYKDAQSVTEEVKKNGLNPDNEKRIEKIQADANIVLPQPPPPPDYNPPEKDPPIVFKIKLPANQIVEKTEPEYCYYAGDRVEFTKQPKGKRYYYSIVNSRKKVKITSDFFGAKGTPNKDGSEKSKIKLEGGPEDLELEIKIIPGYYL